MIMHLGKKIMEIWKILCETKRGQKLLEKSVEVMEKLSYKE